MTNSTDTRAPRQTPSRTVPAGQSPTRVLVVGASGSFGSAVARALSQHPGYAVTATVRPGGSPVSLPGVETVPGDARDRDSLMAASEGAEIIVYGLNVPYHRWHAEMPHNARVLADVAAARKALVVLPGNVYGLGDDFSAPLSEDAGRDAPTEKGRIRNALEAELEAACERGARLLVVRAGDYFGPCSTHTSWMSMLLPLVGQGVVLDPAPADVPHQWAYLPDVAENTVALLDRREELPAVAYFHLAGPACTSAELLAAARVATGRPRLRRLGFPWLVLRMLALFTPLIRELLEMRYLWQQPLLLDDSKLRAFIGPDKVARTPLAEAIAGHLGIANPKAAAIQSSYSVVI